MFYDTFHHCMALILKLKIWIICDNNIFAKFYKITVLNFPTVLIPCRWFSVSDNVLLLSPVTTLSKYKNSGICFLCHNQRMSFNLNNITFTFRLAYIMKHLQFWQNWSWPSNIIFKKSLKLAKSYIDWLEASSACWQRTVLEQKLNPIAIRKG